MFVIYLGLWIQQIGQKNTVQSTETVPVSPLSSNTSDPDDPSNKPLRHSNISAGAKLISSNKIHSPFFTACARVP